MSAGRASQLPSHRLRTDCATRNGVQGHAVARTTIDVFRTGRHHMRAQRFPLTLPIRCRRAGEEGWLEGVTINISSSGVLFRTIKPLDVDTKVEMSIVLGESPARPGELSSDGHTDTFT